MALLGGGGGRTVRTLAAAVAAVCGVLPFGAVATVRRIFIFLVWPAIGGHRLEGLPLFGCYRRLLVPLDGPTLPEDRL